MQAGRLFALLVWLSATAAAQRYGDLCGRVLDTSSGGIPDAVITVVSEDTGFRRVTQTEPGGNYSVGALRPGIYKITVRHEGFIPAVRFGVRLTVSALTHADFVLPVGSITETITVSGNPPLMERQDASTGTTVGRDEIERLPLNGGGLLTLLELSPGTNITPATRGEAGQFTTTGQRPNTNYFTIDGVSANTGVAAGGLPAQSTGGTLPALSAFGSMDSLISLEAVEDLRVTTSTSGASMGRLPGANIALMSRSGSNEFHGTTLYRIRNELFSSNNWFSNQAGYGPLPLRLQDLAQTISGPVKRNRTFFLLSWEGISLRQPYAWRQPVPSLAVRENADWAQPLLSLFPAPTSAGDLSAGIGEWFGRSVRPASLMVGGVRVDQALGSRASLFARYNDSPSSNQFGTISTNQLDLRSQSLTLGVNARPTSSWVLDLRANESMASAHSLWSQPGVPDCSLQPLLALFQVPDASCDYLLRFSIGGIGQLVSGREGDRRQRQFQVLQSAAWHHGGQSLSVGVDYRKITAIRRDSTGALGVIADDLAALAVKKNLWVARAAPQISDTAVQELSLWLQDTWQIRSRVILSAGLRWEYSPPPPTGKNVYFLDPTKNVIYLDSTRPLWPVSHRILAPRLGIAVRLSSSGRTVLRAGGGIYYDSSLSIATDALNGGPLSVGDFTNASGGIFSTLLTYGFRPDLRLPKVEQWNLSLEHAFGSHDMASLGYVGAEGHDLLRRVVGGPGTGPRTYVALTSNNGSSNYQALQLQYRRQLARGLQSQVSYAWSHSIDNDSSDAFLVWEATGFTDRGSSDFDLRHSLTASASYEFPRRILGTRAARIAGGWAADAVFHARSGFPISVLNSEEYLGINLVNAFRPNLNFGQPLWLNDPSVGGGRRLNPDAFSVTPTAQQGTLGRNAIGGFGMSQLDVAIRREFRLTERRRLQFRLEAFNIANHANFADPVHYLNSPVFGQSTSMLNMMLGTGSPGSGLAPILQMGGPRSIQGSLRFQF